MSGVAALDWAHRLGIPHVQSFHSVAAPQGRPLADGEPPESPDRVPGEARVARMSDAIAAISVAEAGPSSSAAAPTPSASTSSRRASTSTCSPDAPGRGPVVAGAAGRRPGLRPLRRPAPAAQGTRPGAPALAHVEKWLRPRLVVAGDYSEDFADYRRSLVELVGRLGLEADVTFVGPLDRPKLARVVRGARLLLVPSHSETFGLVALEAAASGVPVVASAAGGLREAVAHGETGQLMDSREPEEWGRAMTMLLSPRAAPPSGWRSPRASTPGATSGTGRPDGSARSTATWEGR